MDTQNLVRSANKIGDFFVAMPDRTEALAGIANHISKFWAPRMRTQFLAHIDSQSESGLSPIVGEAVNKHRASLEPQANA